MYRTLYGGFVASVLALALMAPAGLQGQQVYTNGIQRIEAPVSTIFGVYTPYITPNYRAVAGLGEPAMTPGFTNVSTRTGNFAWNTYFSTQEQSLLYRNNFVARPEALASFAQAYLDNGGANRLGHFVTVDAVLHGLHATVDEAYRGMERDYAAPVLEDLLGQLSENVNIQLHNERDRDMVEALRRLLAYIETGRALLNPATPVQPSVVDAVDAELAAIAKGARGVSPVLGNVVLDYSLFAPKGYYTQEKTLQQYYQAKTWLSEASFQFRTANGGINPTQARMGFLLVHTMDMLAEEGNFRRDYMSVYEPLAFFNGNAPDVLQWDAVAGAMRGYFGFQYALGTDYLANDTTVAHLVLYMEDQLPAATAKNNSAYTFRLLSQGTNRIEKLFKELKKATTTSSGQALVTGLKGSQTNANSAVTSLRRRPAEDWVQDAQSTALYAGLTLYAGTTIEQGFPKFMRSDAWKARQHMASLGTVASFTNTTNGILLQQGTSTTVPKQSGTYTAPVVYIEPNPEAWGAVASLAGYFRNGFVEGPHGRLAAKEVAQKLRDIETVAGALIGVATAELTEKQLTGEQAEMLESLPQRIAAYETFTDGSLNGHAEVVAAAAPQSYATPGPATGHPIALYVVVPLQGDLTLLKGAIYSYYETDKDNTEWVGVATSEGTEISAPDAIGEAFVDAEQRYMFQTDELRAVRASLDDVATTPIAKSRARIVERAEINLESNVVRRSSGELWLTVKAPAMDGTDIVLMAVNTAGQIVYRSNPGLIENGERLDVIDVRNFENGQYFIRAIDVTGRTFASGRFLVVR